MAARSTVPASAAVAAGQIWDPYTGTFQAPANGTAGAYRSAFIPFNNLATYTSPGNPNLNGTPYQLPQVAGQPDRPRGPEDDEHVPDAELFGKRYL